MKKILVAFIVLIGLAITLSAQTITVTKPALNETWLKGQTYAITWTKSGNMPTTVRISLRDPVSLAEVKLIEDNVSNTGSYQWPVPADVADGQYRVRVKAKDVPVLGDSQVFNVSAAPTGTITVTKPMASDTWIKGQSYAVTWTQTGSLPNQVVISLMNSTATTVVKTITDPAPNSGSCQWLVPADVADGQYRIRVKAKGISVSGDSPIFNIASVPPIGTITILRPAQGNIFYMGQIFLVNWTKTGNLPGQVSISLVNPTETAVILQLVASTANSGSVGMDLPFNLTPGPYRVRVKTIGAEVFGDSQVFNVSPDSLRITQPTTGTKWRETETHLITWTKTGTLPNPVKITLIRENNYDAVKVITEDAPNSGSCSWPVPGDISLGNYRIYIQVKGTVVEDIGYPFYIGLGIPKMPIKIKK